MMCKNCTCQNGLTDMELMAKLEEMGYDFRIANQTKKDVENDTRPLSELSREDFDWSGAYEMAINEGYTYCEKCKRWFE